MRGRTRGAPAQPRAACSHCGKKGLGNTYRATVRGGSRSYRQCSYCSEIMWTGGTVKLPGSPHGPRDGGHEMVMPPNPCKCGVVPAACPDYQPYGICARRKVIGGLAPDHVQAQGVPYVGEPQ